ncbi:MAG: hypothetical protein A2W25_09975 [candidate division Zixibacteria bacterium RBG_16_53_22]|nr:MAG: hypothetical protein A2W25_09975 [candidate division Zixibacteria bacterium RBG_16_53_22]
MQVRELDDKGKPAAPVSLEELAGRKRGRKAKVSEAPPIEIIKVDPAIIRSSFKTGFNVGWLLTNFEGWRLSDEESVALVEAWQPIFDKYIAPHYLEYFIWLNGLGALGGLVIKKVKEQQAWEKEKREKEKVSKNIKAVDATASAAGVVIQK